MLSAAGGSVLACVSLDDMPERLTGPGRFRLLLQPLVATFLGTRSGMADDRGTGGRPLPGGSFIGIFGVSS